MKTINAIDFNAINNSVLDTWVIGYLTDNMNNLRVMFYRLQFLEEIARYGDKPFYVKDIIKWGEDDNCSPIGGLMCGMSYQSEIVKPTGKTTSILIKIDDDYFKKVKIAEWQLVHSAKELTVSIEKAKNIIFNEMSNVWGL